MADDAEGSLANPNASGPETGATADAGGAVGQGAGAGGAAVPQGGTVGAEKTVQSGGMDWSVEGPKYQTRYQESEARAGRRDAEFEELNERVSAFEEAEAARVEAGAAAPAGPSPVGEPAQPSPYWDGGQAGGTGTDYDQAMQKWAEDVYKAKQLVDPNDAARFAAHTHRKGTADMSHIPGIQSARAPGAQLDPSKVVTVDKLDAMLRERDQNAHKRGRQFTRGFGELRKELMVGEDDFFSVEVEVGNDKMTRAEQVAAFCDKTGVEPTEALLRLYPGHYKERMKEIGLAMGYTQHLTDTATGELTGIRQRPLQDPARIERDKKYFTAVGEADNPDGTFTRPGTATE